MLKLVKISAGKKSAAKKQTVKTVTVSRAQSSQPASRHPRRARNPGAGFLDSYALTLNDPFEYPGVPLGYDCFLPTTIGASVIRGSLNITNADGAFSLVLQPDIAQMVQYGTDLVGIAHANSFLGAANAGAVQQSFAELRFVSGGIRAFALFPETSAPGVLFSGTSVDQSQTDWKATTTSMMGNFPGSHIGIGNKGASATLRPYDNGSFEFFEQNVFGLATDSIPYLTSAYICGRGFPVNTVVWYEAILNYEGLARTSSNSVAPPTDDMSPPTMASYFPTPGALFAAAAKLLSPSVVMDAVDVGASAVSGNYGRAALKAGSMMSKIGKSSNFNLAHAATRESTVMIEEMKDEATQSGGRPYIIVRK